MNYKILKVNQKQGWVSLEVTFDDGIVYPKRMMADVTSEEGIHASIQQWLADYTPMREEEKQIPDLSKLQGKVTSVSTQDLPKTSIEQAPQQVAAKAKAEADAKAAQTTEGGEREA